MENTIRNLVKLCQQIISGEGGHELTDQQNSQHFQLSNLKFPVQRCTSSVNRKPSWPRLRLAENTSRCERSEDHCCNGGHFSGDQREGSGETSGETGAAVANTIIEEEEEEVYFFDFRGGIIGRASEKEVDGNGLGEPEEGGIKQGGFRFRSQAPNTNATNDVLDLDLISSHASSVQQRPSSPEEMGQKQSSLWSRPKISLTWALKGDLPVISDPRTAKHSSQERKQMQKNPNPQRQRELRQKKPSKMSELKKSEAPRHEGRRSVSPASSTSTGRPGRRRRPRRPRPPRTGTAFGYEIQDVDEFLTKASLDNPGNIPMVLSKACVLYETHTGGSQREVSLPLGMVVNGVLKNRAWLYAQTPHGEEGYVPYACCLPLGILPAPSRPQPCWDTQTDIFPRPSGNRTDREKLRDETLSEYGLRTATNRKRIRSDNGERSVDGLYLRASRKPSNRHTLLVIGTNYRSSASNKLSVSKGDVVSLVSCHLKDWFWVRDRNGKEGFIPAAVAGHGFF